MLMRNKIECQIEELLDKALNELSPSEYRKLLERIREMLDERD